MLKHLVQNEFALVSVGTLCDTTDDMKDFVFSKSRVLVAMVVTAGIVFSAPAPIKRGPLINGSAPKTVVAPKAAPAPAKKVVAAPMKKAPAKPVVAKPVAAKPAPVVAKKPSAPPPSAPAVVGQGPKAPYRGAIAVDADSGRVLFADNEHVTGRPASVTKLMTFLLVLEDIQAGRYTGQDRAFGSSLAATMEPSKVDICPGQSMTIHDLLLSIMLKSANDAAEVLAEHAAFIRSGGARNTQPPPHVKPEALRDAFVARMNRRAQELGMKDTRYASPNGLPPPPRSKRGFDVSTASDLVKLARVLVKMPTALTYTSRAGCSVMDGNGKPRPLQNHNHFIPKNTDPKHLCTPVEGCDGLKTGFTNASGSSIVLTAHRRGRRVIVVVLSSAGRHEREAAAGRLLRDALDAVSIW